MGFKGYAAAAALMMLAACAGFEPAGRSSTAAPPPPAAPVASAPVASVPPPAPPAAAPAPPPEAAPMSPPVTMPAQPQAAPRRAANNDEVIVPGVREQQVRPPNGDPRTQAERMADISAWDRCVVRVHNMGESDPTKPQLEDPEDYCRRTLGMANRTAVPDSRRP